MDERIFKKELSLFPKRPWSF